MSDGNGMSSHPQYNHKMLLLEQRIATEGKNLGDGILKVDSFINHQVDAGLMMACGVEFGNFFANTGANKILTCEISGIAPALMTGWQLKVPIVYARKTKPVTMPDIVFMTTAPSHTKRRDVEIMASPEYLRPDDTVLIIDDFLATGMTILALVRIAHAAGCKVVGIGTLVEKTFEHGRDALLHLNIPVHALARIKSMANGKIEFEPN